MNKTLKLALGAVLTAGIVMPVLAQDNFPDVPDNHWAYEALARLKKDGLLVGYPDGLFRGNRPASRYELAVAIHATYVHLKSITDGLQSELDGLKQPNADIQAIKDAIAQLQSEVDGMKGWGADIDNLKKLADQFQKELASLGVDVEGLKKDLADLSRRVGVLEAHRLPFDIHGDASFYLYGGNGSGHNFGITTSGRPVGARVVSVAGGKQVLKPAGMDQDSTIYHELTLRLTSNNDTGPKWHGDIIIGDFIGTAPSNPLTAPYSSQSHNGSKVPYGIGTESVYVQDLAVDFDTSIAGQGLAAELGRTGYQIDPYIFKRPDVLPGYFDTDFWGDGKWYFDGGILGFHWGGTKLDLFAGKQSGQTTTSGTSYQPMAVGSLGHPFTPGSGSVPSGLTNKAAAFGIPVDEHLGLNLGVPLGENGKLDLAYIWFESNSGTDWSSINPYGYSTADRADVYGASLKYKLTSNFKFDGGYSASDLREGNHNYTSKDNFAWHGSLAYDAPRLGVEAGYRQVMPQFGAPGDWGRIGIWWNPTDIQGPWVNAHFKLTDQLGFKVSGEWYTGTNTTFNFPSILGGTSSVGLSNRDTVDDYKAQFDYRLNDSWGFLAGIEYVNWHFPGQSPNPYESWYNFGINYKLSEQSFINLLYQYSSYNGEGIVDTYSTPRLAGSSLTTQVTVKF